MSSVAVSFDNGWTDRKADCCVDEKLLYGYKFVELWSNNTCAFALVVTTGRLLPVL